MNLWSHFSAMGLAGWLADFYLLATFLMLVAIVARRRIRQPAQRLTVHWIVAVELAVLAAVCAMPFWPRASLRGAAVQKSAMEKPAVADDPMPRPAPLPRTAFPRSPREVREFDSPARPDLDQPVVQPVARPPRWSWLKMAAAAYLASAGLVVAWLIWGAVAAAKACRHAENAPESLREELLRIVGDGRHAPRLLTSSRVTTAVALGLRRPTILLPAGLLEEASPQAIRAILTHEWAHIRNGDLWLLALGRCLLVLLFPHPLLWWLRRAIRGDQELLADAAAAGDNRPAYAEELLRLVRKTAYPSPIAASVAVGIWESPSQLSRRIAMLLDESFHVEPRTPRHWRYRALGLLLILGTACSLMTLQPARSSGESPPTPLAASPTPAVEKPVESPVARSSLKGEGRQRDERDFLEIMVTRGYALLGNGSTQDQDGFTKEQEERLREISRAYLKDRLERFKSRPRSMAENEAMMQKDSQSLRASLKQIEAALTPGQLESLRKLVFHYLVGSNIIDQPREFLDFVGITAEQRRKSQELGREMDKSLLGESGKLTDSTLAVFSPRQLQTVRTEVEQFYRAAHEPTVKKPAQGKLADDDWGFDLAVATLDAESDDDARGGSAMPVYEDLSFGAVRKALGMSLDQRKQLQKIADEYRTKMEGPATQSEIETKRARLSSEVRQQIEQLLTPQQLTTLKEIVFRTTLPAALADPKVQEKMELSREQKESLARIRQESDDARFRAGQQASEKASALLTPEQREKLYRFRYAGTLNFDDLTPEQKEKTRRMIPGSSDSGSPSTTGSGALTFAGPPAAQPAPAATEVNSGDNVNFDDGTATSTKNLSVPNVFPPYCGIFSPEMRKELNLSAEQCKRLSEVSTDIWKKHETLSKQDADMTDQKVRARYFANIDQLAGDCRKQIEAVVTPQQLEAYKKAVLPLIAFEMLDRPESRKTIGVAGRQEEKLQQIFKESSQQRAQPPTPDEAKRMEQAKNAVLDALSPQQREKLRSQVQQSIRNDEESTLAYFIGTYSGMPIFSGGPIDAGERWAPMVLPFYSELTETAIAQRLGLNADQRKQLAAIEREHRGEVEKLAGEIKKLSPDQRKRPDVQQRALRMLEAVRQRTEAVLSPQQLAALKEIVFRRRAFSTLADPKAAVKIGLNDQQKAAVKRINEEPANKYDRILREAARKLIGVLTPQQQDKIREVMDRQGW